ncbi:MAG: outer membrane beta-barrel protein [Verrucomicrobiales bacterium]|nr:outer membrane beta-barrel protein [Verrucomicrobiales bacterium]
MQTALSNTTLSGYVDVSAQFNPNGGGGTPNYTYGNKANGINLNVVDIALDKPLDESPWASGYHVELWLGPDGDTLGTYTSQGNPTYIRQAYIALRTPVGNGIDWKIGVFDTIIGYESSTSGNNPNYSHSFGFNLEPTTHTGVLAAYKATDWLTAQIGVANTSYAGNGLYSSALNNQMYTPTVMWGPTLTAPESWGWAKGGTLSIGTIMTSGNTHATPGASTGNGAGAASYYAGFTLPTPVAALKFGGSFDYMNARDISANSWALAAYGTYQFNDKLSISGRAEYLNAGGNDGLGIPLNGGAFNQTAAPQQAQELTATLQYNVWENVLTRLEFRWDHVNGENPGAGGPGYTSNTGNNQQNAFLLAAQAIYKF